MIYSNVRIEKCRSMIMKKKNNLLYFTQKQLKKIQQIAWIIIILFIFCPLLTSAPPPLRDQILLNGRWDKGEIIPQYVGQKFSQRTYTRTITIPGRWKGKIIKLDFEAVNFIADIYVDNRHAANHIGAWVPFPVDITKFVKPGGKFKLKVQVKGSIHKPYVNDNNKAVWPVGGHRLDGSESGIVDDVWLRAYGSVYIEDAFIQTSYQMKKLTIEYTLYNSENVKKTVKLIADIIREKTVKSISPSSGPTGYLKIKAEKTLPEIEVTLAPGETKVVQIKDKWPNPALWMPDNPRLYILRSRLSINNKDLDLELRRFGFREIWIKGNKFILNGIRINLRGENIPRNWTNPKYLTPQYWPRLVDVMMKKLNFNVLRFHQFPTANFMLDVADEKGLLIVSESAMYARNFYTKLNKEEKQQLVNNTVKYWTGPWIKDERNHPSIFMWSACNEMRHWVNVLSKSQVYELGAAIRKYDTTRPITHEGDGEVGDPIGKDVVNLHYPEHFRQQPNGSIYKWANMVYPDKPTGSGEIFSVSRRSLFRERNMWWQGTWIRGMRYVNFADIRPFVMHWAWDEDYPFEYEKRKIPFARENLKKSFAPVALFDKEYDELGIDPVMNGEYPSLDEGEKVKRTLVLYNDEFSGTEITVNVDILGVKEGEYVYGGGTKTVHVGLGEHIDIPYSFQVPYDLPSVLIVQLIAKKDGKERFNERKYFAVKETGKKGKSSRQVTFEKFQLPRLPKALGGNLIK